MNQHLSYIHPDAKLAEGVVVEPFTTIAADVVIGEGTWIGPNVTIMDGARIGKNCRVFPGAVISAIPQDLKFQGERTTAEIGDDTTIRECVTVNRGTVARGKTTIGSNCLLMAYVHVAHDCKIGNNCILVNAVQVAGEVNIDDWAIIGGHSAIHQFVNIGGHVMVSGGSLLRKDVPPYVKAGRDPVSYAGINAIGLRRRAIEADKIKIIQDIYRIIFQQKMNVTQALEIVEKEIPNCTEKEYIVTFFRNSKRGVIKGYNSGSSEDI